MKLITVIRSSDQINNINKRLDTRICSNFEIYDPAEQKLTKLEVIPVPSDHAGVTQDIDRLMYLFAKGNSFYFGDTDTTLNNNPYLKDKTIYEYNTDNDEATVLFTDETFRNEKPEVEIFGDYLMFEGGKLLDRTFSVINLTDGSKIVDDELSFSPYLGGDCSYYRNPLDNKWYKLKYPDSTYQGTIEKVEALMEVGEELSDESATVIHLTDKYYIVHDDAGYFLRTYEKGSAEEQVIITKKQIDEDYQK